ncbi:class I SAM-dependent methyltransferase [Bdellovibrionota bacterium FG-1]
MTQLAHTLSFSDKTLRQNAQKRQAGKTLVGIILKQAVSEKLKLRLMKGVNFRQSENTQARKAYQAMTISEFEGINARQQWANWRTVPRNLNGRVPNRPIFAVDLCCGVGQSTEVLSCFLPPHSRILGIEANPEFVARARVRLDRYHHFDGTPAQVAFVARSVLEPFVDEQERPLAPESVDLINCCGAVGVHFRPETTEKLAEQVAYVLRPGGIAMLDSGPHGTNAKQLTSILKKHGFERINAVKSCFIDYSVHVCFRKLSH